MSFNFNSVISSSVNFLLNKSKSKLEKKKTYDYSQSVCGRDYVFELVDDLKKAYMTGQGKGIKRGDYIILRQGAQAQKYLVEQIDYYSEPPDMWMALLRETT